MAARCLPIVPPSWLHARMRALLLLVTSLVASACSQPKPPPPAPRPAEPQVVAPSPTPEPPKPPTFAGVPETPAGVQLAWVLDTLVRHKGEVTKDELEKRFDPKFLAEVPPDRMVSTFKMLGAELANLAVVSVKGDDMKLVARAVVGSDKLQILLNLDAGSRKIVGLLLRPDAEGGPKPKTFDEAITMTTALAPKAQLLVAALDKGACKSLHRTGGSDALAIGSTTKLYVLLGLVDRIVAGKAKWEDELAVRDDWKSLPSGITQDETAGKKIALRELATRMISISDNTATDHLLHTVGRDKVEAAMRSTKHGKPKLNTPFLSTRELFLFRLGMTDAEIEAYKKLPESKRREYLDKQLAGKTPTLEKIGDWKTARRIDEIEWFATSDDLCRAMGTLWQRAQKPAANGLLDVLAKNPGMEIDKTRFPYAGFKGGSEPGVINLTWLLKRADEKWFVVVLTANAREGVVDEAKSVSLASGVVELLGAQK